MADGHTPSTRLNAWTTYADLNADQRARFGEYVQLKDEARARAERNQAGQARTAAIMDACGGNKARAFAMALAQSGQS